jgi:hypothetical protein
MDLEVTTFLTRPGDFITVVTAIHTICRALRENGGAASEYQSTVKLLELITAILERAQLHVSIRTQNPEIPVLLNALCAQSAVCYTFVQNFTSRVSRYDPSLGKTAPRGFKGIWSKAKWAQWFSSELSTTWQEIGKMVAMIQTTMALVQT